MISKNLNGLKVLMKLGGISKVREFVLNGQSKINFDLDDPVHTYLLCFFIKNRSIYDMEWIKRGFLETFSIKINTDIQNIIDKMKVRAENITQSKKLNHKNIAKNIFKRKCIEILKEKGVNSYYFNNMRFVSPARINLICLKKGKKMMFKFVLKGGKIITEIS